MSRHYINPLFRINQDGTHSVIKVNEEVSVVVGWDVPLQTMFGDVEVNGKPTLSTMIDLGRFDIYDPNTLEKFLGYHIPDATKDILLNERDNSASPTRLQATIAKAFDPRNMKGKRQ